jgi:hypothetical protein
MSRSRSISRATCSNSRWFRICTAPRGMRIVLMAALLFAAACDSCPQSYSLDNCPRCDNLDYTDPPVIDGCVDYAAVCGCLADLGMPYGDY